MDSPTLLCIHDLPAVLEVRKAILESHGCRVKVASSGYDAMKMLEEASVSAVLLEYKQEGMDAEAVPAISSIGFPTCRSSFSQLLRSAGANPVAGG
jgi:CheY-like chemotaxis protein